MNITCSVPLLDTFFVFVKTQTQKICSTRLQIPSKARPGAFSPRLFHCVQLSGCRDLNPDCMLPKQVCYRYTTPRYVSYETNSHIIPYKLLNHKYGHKRQIKDIVIAYSIMFSNISNLAFFVFVSTYTTTTSKIQSFVSPETFFSRR